MFTALLILGAVVIAGNAFLAGAVLYHVNRFTLPGWTAARTVLPLYAVFAIASAGLALLMLFIMPPLPPLSLPAPLKSSAPAPTP